MPAENWSFGWDALVAVGTVGLAAVTAWLAWTTREVARATRDELAASWRPLLVYSALRTRQTGDDTDERQLELVVRNDGKGPALAIAASTGLTVPSGFRAATSGLIPVGGEDVLTLSVPLEVRTSYRIGVDYVDLAGRKYSSDIDVEVPVPDLGLSGGQTYVPPGALVQQRFYVDRHLTGDETPTTLSRTFAGSDDSTANR